MADHTIRKISHSGVGYSVVDLNDVRHVFAAATPLAGSTFDQQADDALRTIQAVIGEGGHAGSIVHQAVFLADMSHVARCRQIMRELLRFRTAGDQLHPPAALRREAVGHRGPRRGTGPWRGGNRADQRRVGHRPA